jgi:hypothetical protein
LHHLGRKQIWATEFGEPTSKVDEAIQDFITTRDRNTGSSNPQERPTASIEPTGRPSRPRT